MPTTGGSLALTDVVPTKDAAIVTKLKAAGAIILGKVNVTELNGMVATGMPAGYGSLHGQVLNPYDVRTSTNGVERGRGGGGRVRASRPRPSASRPTRRRTAPTTPPTARRSTPWRPRRRPAWPRSGRRSGSSRAPASCRWRARRTSRRRSASRSRTSPPCCRAWSARDPADAATAGAPGDRARLRRGADQDARSRGKRIGVIAPDERQLAGAVHRRRGRDHVARRDDRPADGAQPARRRRRSSTASSSATSTPTWRRTGSRPPGSSRSTTPTPRDTLKFGQARLRAAAAIDLTDPATATAYAQRPRQRPHGVARPTSTRCWPTPARPSTRSSR